MNTLILASRSHPVGIPLLSYGIALALIGGINGSRPDLSWRMRRWQFKNKAAMEPSAAGLRVTRIVGIAMFTVGIVLIVIGATKL